MERPLLQPGSLDTGIDTDLSTKSLYLFHRGSVKSFVLVEIILRIVFAGY
jgi:hypothetical protein